ncbi:MAG: hypothetical protein J7M01_01610, partial [Candidatus Marinimicrobia bacterium]|nr:hypothetical protein [Candidatus Neomarinimicrobiota bacterium]
LKYKPVFLYKHVKPDLIVAFIKLISDSIYPGVEENKSLFVVTCRSPLPPKLISQGKKDFLQQGKDI